MLWANNRDSRFQVSLRNVPTNANQRAYYLFRVPPVKLLSKALTLAIEFPNEATFVENIGINLECGVFSTEKFDLFDRMTLTEMMDYSM